MIITLPYHAGDRDTAQRLVQFMDELGEYPNHRLILFREQGSAPITPPKNFGSVGEVMFANPYQTEPDERKRWAKSTTQAFQTVARYIEANDSAPFLFLEPDCIPLKPTWVDEIEAAYKQGKKPFMGALVPRFGDAPEHMSGIGVYPAQVVQHAGAALYIYEDSPWDTSAAAFILPKAQTTDLIVHRWDRPPKPPVKSVDEIYQVVTTEAVLFHGNKDGSWIEVLRKTLGGAEVRHALSTDAAPAQPASFCSTGSRARQRAKNNAPAQLSEPKEGTRNNGMVWKNGSWHPETLTLSKGGPDRTANWDASSETWKWVDPVDVIKARFTSPLAKARIIRSLKAAPIIK